MSKRWMQFISVAVFTWLCGCAPPAQQPPGATAVAVDTDTLLKSLTSLVDDEMVAGAVGLAAHNGEVVFRGAVGYADRESNAVMSAENLFRIASMTKAITSVAVMILVEEGHFILDDEVSRYIPALADLEVLEENESGSTRTLAARSEITIRQLLTHTSGLNYRFIARGALGDRYAEADISDGLVTTPWDLATEMEKLGSVPLTHHPGERWTYGLSTDVLGYLVEVVSGMRLDHFMRERILDPLGMSDTHFFLDETDWGRLATVYRPDGAGGLDPIVGTVEDGPTNFSVDAVTTGPRMYYSGGGGLVSSIDDYFRFCQMILNRGKLDGARILSAETVDTMADNQIGELSLGLTEDKFGLGFSIASAERDGIPRGVIGWGGFYGSEFWIDRDNGIVAVFMSQVYDLPRRNEIVGRFGAAVFRTLVPQHAD